MPPPEDQSPRADGILVTIARAPAEVDQWSSDAIALWERIRTRINDRLQTVEQAVVVLLERPLRAEEVTACKDECALVARWVFSLELAVAGRIIRDLAEDFDADTLTSRDAAGLASRIEDFRRVLRIGGDDWLDRMPAGPHVHMVSRTDARTDALMWHLRRGGLRVTNTTRFVGSPNNPDTMVLFWPGESRDAGAALAEIARWSGDIQRVLIHGPDAQASDLRDVARDTDLLLSIHATSAELAHEIRLVALRASTRGKRVVSYGAELLMDDLRDYGFDIVEAVDINEAVERLAGAEHTVIVGSGVADAVELVSLVRSTPSTRDSVIAVVATSPTMASRCRQLGVDLLIEPDEAVDSWALHLSGLVKRRNSARVMLAIETGETAGWASSVVVFERALASLGRSSSTAALAMISLPQDFDERRLRAVREGFSREFRTVDLLAESEDGLLLVLLRGATREAAVSRIQIALESVEIPATPGRAGVAEFPIDGYSLGDLMMSAAQAADRSAGAQGPAVVASGWLSEDAERSDVVLVESDHTLALILAQLLDHLGLTSTHVFTGSDALRNLSGPSAVRLPRLIMIELDAMGADGLMVLRSLARHGVMSRTKVIVTCARIRDGELREAFELGAVDVVVKPFSAVVLSNRIRQVLGER